MEGEEVGKGVGVRAATGTTAAAMEVAMMVVAVPLEASVEERMGEDSQVAVVVAREAAVVEAHVGAEWLEASRVAALVAGVAAEAALVVVIGTVRTPCKL